MNESLLLLLLAEVLLSFSIFTAEDVDDNCFYCCVCKFLKDFPTIDWLCNY